jgi:site-specific DNA recombinase
VSALTDPVEQVAAKVDRITLGARSVDIRLHPGPDHSLAPQTIVVPWTSPSFRRKREFLRPLGEAASPARPIRAEARTKLVSAIAKGRRWLDEMISGKVSGVEDIAERDGLSERSARMISSLAFLAPDIVQAAVDGTLARGFGVSRLTDLPPSWVDQRKALGILAPAAGDDRRTS